MFEIKLINSQAISNIFQLLKPNGTALLVFLASHVFYDIYWHLSKEKKYAQYMHDVKKFLGPYHLEKKPLESFSEKLHSAGFKIHHIEIKALDFMFDSVELLKGE